MITGMLLEYFSLFILFSLMDKALKDMKDPKEDLYCLVRQFYMDRKDINPSFHSLDGFVSC